MTTVLEQAPPGAVQPRRPGYKVTGARVVRSEWAKFWSLRSTWITLAVALVSLVGFGVIAALHYKSVFNSGRPLDHDLIDASAVQVSLFGTTFAQLALGVLGVLVTAGEYSTGMIRSTLAAVPRRLPVLWSKAAMFGLVALVLATAGAFGAFVLGNSIVAGTPAAISLSAAGVVRSLLGAGVYLALVAVIGVALGALLRSVAGAISVLVVALMLIPGLISLLPRAWNDAISPYLPGNAGESIFALHQHSASLSPIAGLGVLIGWAALALSAAAYRLVRSDG
jgi:hypothetical protein